MAHQLLGIDFLQSAESGTEDLAAEVDSYLAVPTGGDIIGFWQVRSIFHFKGHTKYLLGKSSSISNSIQACYGYNPYTSILSSM
jgi:hypothetical protein